MQACLIPCIPHPFPSPWSGDALTTKTTAMKSQPFWVEGSGFWPFPHTSTLFKVGLAGQL